MTKQSLLIIAAILETLSEVDGAPESYIWLGLQKQIGSLDDFQEIIGVMRDSKLIKVSHNYVTITKKGQDLVQKVKECNRANT